MGIFIANSITTTINIKKWYKLNHQMMNERRLSVVEKILDQIEKLAKEEMKNAEATSPIVEKDSRLGWEPRMEYMTDDGHLNWKISQLHSVINGEIPKYRSSLKFSQ